MARTRELNTEYGQALTEYVQRRDEEALLRASALGRAALASGLGVFDIVQAHHGALSAVLRDGMPPEQRESAIDAAGEFLCESLSTFEMAQRGFLDISDSVTRMVEFNAVICHELRTPLTSIVTSLGMLGELLHAAPRSAEARLLANMRTGAEILRARTADLQDLVGFQSGTLRLKLKTIDIGEVVRRCAQRMEPEFERAGVRLTVEAAEGGDPIVADPDRIDQVIANLLQNALKYGADGMRVDLRAFPSGPLMVVEVRDYGRGVSAWDRARIFQPRVRGSDVKPEIPGLGIGLALSRELVLQHQGTLTLESEEGKGSVFRIELPRDAAESDEAYEGADHRRRG
jgi:signal transduction histidine kinase